MTRTAPFLAAALLSACAGLPGGGGGISADDLASRIETLADDRYAGRAPASPEGEAAADWIAEEMARAGLEPAGENGTYFQEVPLVRATLDTSASSLTIAGGAPVPLAYGDNAVFWTKQTDPDLAFENSEMVFVGYGATAPEYGWDDYAGLDVRGKTVVMMVNDPGYATQDPELFTGRSMTYYGRWTYKFEEAGRRGAAAAIVIHETAPASYGWDVVTGSWTGPQFDLVRPDGGASRAMLEGWVTREAAERLFASAGLDFETLKAAARERDFRPVRMGDLRASGRVVSDIVELNSRNIAGVVRGTERPDEVVLMTAHWDHLGSRDVPPGEDGVYNGAVDNATGVAAVLEVAEALAADPPARSVMALMVTAEEDGLLGSEFFGESPLVPLAQIVGGLNIDALLPIGPARDIVVVGYGASELEDILARHAAAAGKTLTPDPNPEAGYFYRSDHISLAKRGVPMLYAEPGEDLVEGGTAAGAAAQADYRDNRYHAPADEYDPATWDFTGILETLEIDLAVVRELAESDAWPTWYDGNEFRALRDAQRAGAD
jgi:Zn-dependent M28 family amino/carboxypeptidase